ncbi:MAG: DUF4479 domain-containing protein [Erysipelotrichales bacterium]
MKYNAFYVDGNLLIRIAPKDTTTYKKEGNVVALYNGEELVGYNLLEYNDNSLKAGKVKLNEELHNKVNEIIKEKGFEQLELELKEYFSVGYVESIEKHPDSNKLSITQVDLGDEKVQIVCGASNVDAGQKVVVARVGAIMKDGTWILKGKLLKVDSFGMICSARELGLEQTYDGILVLDDSYEVGADFIV